jgi:galactose mutarotase-like enzyme
MTKIIISIALAMILVLPVMSILVDFTADATKSQGTYVKQFGSATKNKVCGDRLCSEVGQEPKKEAEKKKEEVKTEKKSEEQQKATESMEEQKKAQQMAALPPWQTATGTLVSTQDPGIGHETHQLAIILPPSDKVYRGQLTYSASENIQLVALHGPLKAGEDKGQPIWTPDGKIKYALTLVDNKDQMGTWRFAGNALAVHTMNEDPFTVTYSVTYRERTPSPLVMTSTIQSTQDPGIGHESHQLAIIMPPSERTYNGVLTYSASEPIQLVALHGPLLPGQDMGQPTWSPDGKTKFALTFVDPKTNMGSWTFSGNAIAVHTMKPDKFTVSYSVVAGS